MSGLFALGGTIIGGLITYFIQVKTQKIQSARHKRELAVKVALDEWREHFNLVHEQAKTAGSVVFRPPTDYLITYIPIVERIFENDLHKASPEELSHALQPVEKSIDDFFAAHPRRYHDTSGKTPDFDAAGTDILRNIEQYQQAADDEAHGKTNAPPDDW